MSLESWKGLFETVSVALLFLTFVAGAGALYFSNRVNRNQAARLRKFDADLTGAKTELGEQQERAANADARVAGLERDAANAKAIQQRVEIDLARQQEKTAAAEQSLLQLQRRMEPRRISSEQRTRLIAALRSGPKGPISVSCVVGDGEGCRFAEQIKDVLAASGWENIDGGQGMYSGGTPVGFFLRVRDATTPPPSAALLQRAFFSIGIPIDGTVVPSLNEGTIEILVGNKPQL